MIIPKRVRKNATIYVAQVAGKPHDSPLKKGIEVLQEAGFEVRYNSDLQAEGYLAGSDEARAKDLIDAIKDESIDAIIFGRGGYGSMRILERIPDNLLVNHPKWLVGYSDITAIHLWAQTQNVASIHGTLVESLANNPQNLDSLLSLFGGAKSAFEVRVFSQGTKDGIAKGKLIGGNLSLLTALLGTRWFPNLDNKILFIEEVDEKLYRLDRMIHSLILDGRAAKLQGVVFGDFTKCGSSASKKVAKKLSKFFLPLQIPIAYGLPIGHNKRNDSIMLGASYELNTNKKTLIQI